jgi:hypothetical protein
MSRSRVTTAKTKKRALPEFAHSTFQYIFPLFLLPDSTKILQTFIYKADSLKVMAWVHYKTSQFRHVVCAAPHLQYTWNSLLTFLHIDICNNSASNGIFLSRAQKNSYVWKILNRLVLSPPCLARVCKHTAGI